MRIAPFLRGISGSGYDDVEESGEEASGGEEESGGDNLESFGDESSSVGQYDLVEGGEEQLQSEPKLAEYEEEYLSSEGEEQHELKPKYGGDEVSMSDSNNEGAELEETEATTIDDSVDELWEGQGTSVGPQGSALGAESFSAEETNHYASSDEDEDTAVDAESGVGEFEVADEERTKLDFEDDEDDEDDDDEEKEEDTSESQRDSDDGSDDTEIYEHLESDEEHVITIESDNSEDHEIENELQDRETYETYAPPGLDTASIDDFIGKCRASAAMSAAHSIHTVSEGTEGESNDEKRSSAPERGVDGSMAGGDGSLASISDGSSGKSTLRKLLNEFEVLRNEISEMKKVEKEVPLLRQERDTYEKELWKLQQEMKGKPKEEEVAQLRKERDIFEQQAWKLRQAVGRDFRESETKEDPAELTAVVQLLKENQSLMMHVLNLCAAERERSHAE